MIALALALVALQGQKVFIGSSTADTRGTLEDGTGMYWLHGKPTDDPQRTPQTFGNPPKPYEFYYHTDGYANVHPETGLGDLRFRVFSQSPTRNQLLGKPVAFELLVLWRMLHDHLGLDHKTVYEDGIVDVYLCEGGAPGGEQAIEPIPGASDTEADSIYIYDVAHFDDKMEQAREVAHEYGHAVIPPVGGFENTNGAEYWANGNLGEKLFLRWGRDGILAHRNQESNFMSVPFVQLDYWVRRHVDPLVHAAAERSPNSPLLRGTNRQAFDAYQGIVLWCDSIMPSKMFGRSMTLIGSEHARDYVASAVQAAEESSYSPTIPSYLAGSKVWIPVGHGRVTGGHVYQSKLGWSLVRPGPGRLVVHEPPVSD